MAHRSEEAVGKERHSRPGPGRQGVPVKQSMTSGRCQLWGIRDTPLGQQESGFSKSKAGTEGPGLWERGQGRGLGVWQESWSDRGGGPSCRCNHQSYLDTTHETFCWEALQELDRSAPRPRPRHAWSLGSALHSLPKPHEICVWPEPRSLRAWCL